MKRKSIFLTLLMMSCLLTFNPVHIHADNTNEIVSTSSWLDYHFEDAKKPSQGTELVYADSIGGVTSEDNLFGFTLASGSYKILSYDGVVYGTTTAIGVASSDEEFGNSQHEYTYETLVPYTNSTDLSVILTNEPVRTKGDFFKTCSNLEGYVLFFKDNATSIKDLKFVCRIADLNNYAVGSSRNNSTSVSTSANSSVSLVEKIEDSNANCSSAKFKVNFNLGSCNVSDMTLEEQALCIVIDNDYNISLDNKNSGEIEFTLNNLENKTYNYYIKSSNGNKYYGSFAVDFVTGIESDIVAISDEVPVVTFEGYPTEKVALGSEVQMKMVTSNVDSMMTLNGAVLGNGAYGRSFEFTVTQNGSYYYSAMTVGGKVIDGELVIDFFEGVPEDEKVDPINNNLSDVDNTSSLVQTGVETNIAVFAIAGLLILFGSFLLFRKVGAKNNEENQ